MSGECDKCGNHCLECKCSLELSDDDIQINGEKLNHRKWKSIAIELPKDKSCVEFASHQYYGLANWSKDKGFHEVFLTSGPFEEAEYFKDCDAWNGEVMWWREICQWPYYGRRGCDAKTMKNYKIG